MLSRRGGKGRAGFAKPPALLTIEGDVEGEAETVDGAVDFPLRGEVKRLFRPPPGPRELPSGNANDAWREDDVGRATGIGGAGCC